jgi:hypothetical protein
MPIVSASDPESSQSPSWHIAPLLWARIAVVSSLVVVPCFWQGRIEAGDLRSHTYNAWLVQLIHQGRAPGLWIARLWNNVLFDYLLGGIGALVGLHSAERIAASLVVLTFFWGAFALVSATTGRSPWLLTPFLAAITFGWTYNAGFFNFLLSLGLSFFALAAFLALKGPSRIVSVIGLPLVLLAHPMGVAWAAGAAAFVTLAAFLSRRFRWLLAVGAVAALAIIRWYTNRHYWVSPPPHSIVFYNGLDQLIFTSRYVVPVLLFGAVFVIALTRDLVRPGGFREFLARAELPILLFLVVEAAAQLLPYTIHTPSTGLPLTDLTDRLTSISAVLLCCVLGAVNPRAWHLPALAVAAGIFFIFLYQDTQVLNRMEDQVDNLVAPLAGNARILATVVPPLKYRFSVHHLVEPICLGRCFSFANYEPPSGVFRVRAEPGNPFVVSDIHDASAAEQGTYVVKAQDLPVYQIYQCSPVWTELCLRPLRAGEQNDRLGVHFQNSAVQGSLTVAGAGLGSSR